MCFLYLEVAWPLPFFGAVFADVADGEEDEDEEEPPTEAREAPNPMQTATASLMPSLWLPVRRPVPDAPLGGHQGSQLTA